VAVVWACDVIQHGGQDDLHLGSILFEIRNYQNTGEVDLNQLVEYDILSYFAAFRLPFMLFLPKKGD